MLLRQFPRSIQLPLTQLPRRPNLCDGTRNSPLHNLVNDGRSALITQVVVSALNFDEDQGDTRVLRAAGVDAISQVTKPGSQIIIPEVLDFGLVIGKFGDPGHAHPLAGAVLVEGEVDVGVELEFFHFVGLVVGDEPGGLVRSASNNSSGASVECVRSSWNGKLKLTKDQRHCRGNGFALRD